MGDNLWSKATPLSSNDEFRKLLETPRPAGAPKNYANSIKQQQRRAAVEQGGQERKPKKPPPKFSKTKDKQDAAEDGPGYRDRAKERREGLNLDYQTLEQELAASLQTKGLGNDLTKLSVEESKFLGGDMDHTHLVKGLDFALLQKERSKLEQEREEAAEKDAARAKVVKKEDQRFVTPLGSSVFDAIFNPPRVDIREMFLPRRTAFVYDFDSEESGLGGGALDIPTTLRRSKMDCPPVQDTVFAAIDTAVLERLAKIMAYMKMTQGGVKGGKKVKAKERQEAIRGILQGGEHRIDALLVKSNLGGATAAGAAAATAAADKSGGAAAEDEDIFGDAGRDYVPTVKEKRGEQQAERRPESYFGKRDDMSDILVSALAPSTATNQPQRPGEQDMEVEEGEVGAPPPPPPPPPNGPQPPSYPPHDGTGHYPPGHGAVATDAYGYATYPAYDPAYQQYYQQPGGYVDPNAYQQGPYMQQPGGMYPADEYQQYDAAVAAGHYGPTDAAAVEPAPAGPRPLTQQEKDAGLGSVFKKDETKWRPARKPSEAGSSKAAGTTAADVAATLKAAAAADDGDAYAECYPEYHHTGTEVVDSDEEADYTKMDSRGKQGASKYDFDTEEDYQNYKNKKEAMPKAAFQFGVKMSDGRKTHKDLAGGGAGGSDKRREHKLNDQLNKIQGIFKDKGMGNEAAFRKPEPLQPIEQATPQRKRQRI